MSFDLESFDVAVKATEKLRQACKTLGLDESGCKKLERMVGEICGTLSGGKRESGGSKRLPTRWQQCIRERRAGKPFDPQAIKELSKEYKAGRCPSGS